ncbi:hypothetical protein OFAG_00918 [Oxalobacter formigenes HOxBLS]|uniref:Sel1 repeat family protein n=2 Tax=Oxalobacter paraformigenes TaxID=556268 RepID=C3X3H9_9BURK|nr:hypothetical protein OFAG_00918 [Oxalobacter paraformigenes]
MLFVLSACHKEEKVATDKKESVQLYLDGQVKKAFPLLKNEAEKGDAQAQYYLAEIYEEGKSVKQDNEKALYWYRQSAEKNHALAEYKLAEAFRHGKLGLKSDRKEAFKWYLKAAENGNAAAQKTVAGYYLEGEPIPKNHAEALKWFKKAQETRKDDKELYTKIGIMYYSGLGTLRDTSEAAKWFEKAAILGDSHAQSVLAVQYYSGQGVLMHKEKAKYWAEKAAAQGNDVGEFILGMLCHYRDIPDMKQAVAWYKKAAEKNNEAALHALAVLYEQGNGVRQDSTKAHHYYRLAAQSGKDYTIKALADFEAKNKLENRP